MGLSFSIYVGPYLVVPESANLYAVDGFDDIVWEIGRETRKDGEKRLYAPNQTLPGTTRQNMFDRDDSGVSVPIMRMELHYEIEAFKELIKPVIEHLNKNETSHWINWGIVTDHS